MHCLLPVFIFGVVAYAQLPRPCLSPKQFEARVASNDRNKKLSTYAKLSYDETQRRIRMIEEVQVGSQQDFYDILYLHNVGKEYRLSLKTRKCNITNLMRPFRPYGIPPEGQFDGSATVGAAGIPGEYMVVNNFHGNYSDGSRFFGSVTSPDCVPVTNAYYSEETGFEQEVLFDINIGIANPMVFIPPRECLV